MRALTPAAVARYRRVRVRGTRLRTASDALRFINRLGFCYAFSGGPGGLPGLFDVIATSSVDRMWSWTWQWKDELATARRVYYGKIIRRKPSYISLAILPAFYALSGNIGEPDDHEQAFREGRLSVLAKAVYEHVLASGPVSTWTLRRLFVQRGESGARFHRALADLQERFLIAKAAEVEGRGNYSFIWDAFHRWMPDVAGAAARLTAGQAAASILGRYVAIVGVAGDDEIDRMFGWDPRLRAAAAEGAHFGRTRHDGREVWVHPHLLGA